MAPWPDRDGPALLALVAVLFLAGHLPFLPSTPDDLDSVNFALGIADFNPPAHQPHPPGSTVYIGLGKATNWLVERIAGDGDGHVYLTLALLSGLFGAAAIFPAFVFFRSLEQDRRRALAAAILTVSCPLFWLNAVRPLSDIPTLTVALCVQAAFAWFLAHPAEESDRFDALLWAAAFVMALAVGMRVQTAVVTVPLLLLVCLHRLRARRAGTALAGIAIAMAIAVTLWALPLLAASGGLSAYLEALGSMADADFSGVDMLATSLTPARLARSLGYTFVLPWASTLLGGLVLVTAVVGLATMTAQARRSLTILLAATVPYVIFHLAFQETLTSRYALPAVPAVAYLAVRGLDVLVRRAMIPAVTALVIASLMLALPVTVAIGGQPSPLFAMLSDVRADWRPDPAPAFAMHGGIAITLRGERLPDAPRIPTVFPREWLEMSDYWLGGGGRPVWFFARPGRTDLTLVDPASRRLMAEYRWPFDTDRFLSGARPASVDWHEIQPPAWILGPGFALTPEVRNVSNLFQRGQERPTLEGWVRRDALDQPSVLLIGGRYSGTAQVAQVRVSVDDVPLDQFEVSLGRFLRLHSLPARAAPGPDNYGVLRVETAEGRRTQRTLNIDQFDFQPATSIVLGYGTAWSLLEHDPASDRLVRWTGPSATLRIHHGGRDVVVTLTGEVPPDRFERPPRVDIRIAGRLHATFEPATEFHWTFSVPAAVLQQGEGEITISTDTTFATPRRSDDEDRRPPGLKIFDVRVGRQ